MPEGSGVVLLEDYVGTTVEWQAENFGGPGGMGAIVDCIVGAKGTSMLGFVVGRGGYYGC